MKIIFHFGPPKTGTSAIQKWLVSNRGWLQEKGIYYPEHTIDVNGVSSGNVESVFEKLPDGSLIFSKARYDAHLKIAQDKGYECLLFSSEYFYRQLKLLAKEVPQSLFIGYIRFDLKVLQSSYNQSVKRHGMTERFVPQKDPSGTLRALSHTIDFIGEQRFHLRPFSRNLFFKGSLIADFLNTIGVCPTDPHTSVEKVNSSYCIESIEVKRWFNQFPIDKLQAQLDLALQEYGSNESFSLFTDEEFARCKKFYLRHLQRFLNKYDVVNKSGFFAECARLKNARYIEQKMNSSEFEKVLRGLIKQKKLSSFTVYRIYVIAKEYKHDIEYPERIPLLREVVPISVRYLTEWQEKIKRIFTS